MKWFKLHLNKIISIKLPKLYSHSVNPSVIAEGLLVLRSVQSQTRFSFGSLIEWTLLIIKPVILSEWIMLPLSRSNRRTISETEKTPPLL